MKLKKTLTLAVMSAIFSISSVEAATAYVSNQDGGVTVIDTDTMMVTDVIDVKGDGPRGLAVSDDGKLLVVATRENGNISVIDTATKQVIKQIPVGKNPEFVRIKGSFCIREL